MKRPNETVRSVDALLIDIERKLWRTRALLYVTLVAAGIMLGLWLAAYLSRP